MLWSIKKVTMTQALVRAIPDGMERKKRWTESVIARLPAGTIARIEQVLGETEIQADFLREVILEGLRRREAKAKPAKPARRGPRP